MYFFEYSKKAVVAGENVWIFFHASTVPDSNPGDRGTKRRPSYAQSKRRVRTPLPLSRASAAKF